MRRTLVALFAVTFFFTTAFAEVLAANTTNTTKVIDQNRVIRIALPDQASINSASLEKFQLLVNFLKEYWQIWAIDHQVEVAFFYLPTITALKKLENDEIDVISINIYQRHHDHLLYSIPYAKFKQSIFRNINNNDKDGVQLAIYSDDKTTLDFLAPHIERQYFTDIDLLLNNYQQYDAIYATRPWLIEEKLNQLGIKQQFYLSQEEIPEITLHFTTRATDRDLLYLINDSIRNVKPAQAHLWFDKYLSSHDTNFILTLGDYFQNIGEQEKQFIIDNNLVTYPVTREGLPPFIITQSFDSISERGFLNDLMKYTTTKTGIIFTPLYVDNVEQLKEKVNNNKAGVLVNIEPNHSKKNNYTYSIPYLKSHYSVVYNPSVTKYEQLADIRHTTIAAVKGFHSTTLLKQRFRNTTIKLFDSLELALTAVADAQAEVFVGRSLTTAYLIKQKRLSNLTTKPIPDFNRNAQLTFATLEQNAVLISLLNKTIQSLTADQLDAMYAKWSQTAFPDADVQEQIAIAYRQASYVFFTILLIALIAFWIYYRQLQVRKIAQKKIEHALAIAEAAREEAEESARAKITFLTRMSHEIRTPMNGVLGMAEALNFTKLNQEQAELLDTLEGSARHLLALLNDVLDFSKIDAGKLTLESVPVNLRVLASNVIKSFKHIEKEADLTLTLTIDDDINKSYFTDPTRLNQVLNNLVGNAAKFTQEGEIGVSIRVLDHKVDIHDSYDTLRISVSDTGIGISPAQQQLLFTPFIQADSDTTRRFGGTGLGLSICQEIIIAMGGIIKIDSEEGNGSTFYFDLTFKTATQETESSDRRKNNRATSAPHDNRFDNIRVLVAEDNLVNVKVLTAQLSRLNIQSDVAYDGVEALELHNKHAYDIIISDCHMPHMDGFELAQAIKRNVQHPIWLIAVTADALSGAADKCIAAGFDDYMAKPCPQEEITNKLNHAYRSLQLLKAEE